MVRETLFKLMFILRMNEEFEVKDVVIGRTNEPGFISGEVSEYFVPFQRIEDHYEIITPIGKDRGKYFTHDIKEENDLSALRGELDGVIENITEFQEIVPVLETVTMKDIYAIVDTVNKIPGVEDTNKDYFDLMPRMATQKHL